MRLDVPAWPGHRPGQHLDVRLTAPDGYQAARSYSIGSPPEDDRLEITVELFEDGEVSPYLVEIAEPGDQIEILGPIGGHFVWTTHQGGPLLLIAGGSGVVPLMAMIRHRAHAGDDVPTRLLFSARSHQDIIYRQELENLSGQDAALDVTYTLTRRQPTGWTGYARRVDSEMIADVAWPPETAPRVYVCGPTPFVELVASLLVEMGYDPDVVKTERFGPTG